MNPIDQSRRSCCRVFRLLKSATGSFIKGAVDGVIRPFIHHCLGARRKGRALANRVEHRSRSPLNLHLQEILTPVSTAGAHQSMRGRVFKVDASGYGA